jgi:hypothetical protein
MFPRRLIVAGTALCAIATGFGAWISRSADTSTEIGPAPTPLPRRAPLRPDPNVTTPSQFTSWPWPGARQDNPHPGVTHYYVLAKDGTTVDALHFDLKKNPRLRFELYSQDQDDQKPWDNIGHYLPMGVGQAVRHLNQSQRGPVVAAWNGPFFGYYHRAGLTDAAFHLAPVVIDGKLHHNGTNHRWTFGVKYRDGKPTFKLFHLPGREVLQREFDFASGTIQCLIKDGKVLRLQPFPRPGQLFPKQPVPSTPQEVGHIPYFDHAKFARASIGWSKDNQQLWMILVHEPKQDGEGQSIRNLIKGNPQEGGWNVPDLQRFWKSLLAQGLIWNAINSDAGGVGQLCYLLPDGNYNLIPPGSASPLERKIFTPQFQGAPQEGALMYFYVREEKK